MASPTQRQEEVTEALSWSLAWVRNELGLRAGAVGIWLASFFVARSIRRRVGRCKAEARRLSAQYGIGPATPIVPWSPQLQEKIDRVRAETSHYTPYAMTSGSTGRPKRIPFPPVRLARVKRTSFEAIVQTAALLRIRQPRLFVLAGTESGASLSNILLSAGKVPGFVEGLIFPSGCLRDPGLKDLSAAHGTTALRLVMLILNNPPILYATNPSTLATFLSDIEAEWPRILPLLRAVAERPIPHVPDRAAAVLRRVLTCGWQARVAQATAFDLCPGLARLVPGLRCYCCWDGGYVTPFLDEIRTRLSGTGIRHVPMYSMSTECIQTQMAARNEAFHFLPMAPGVLYEFLPEGQPAHPDALLPPDRLQTGQAYVMVVSDAYGLRRYATEDVFLCAGHLDGLPDLRFLRRSGMTYSFTGEKVTGAQVEQVLHHLLAGPDLARSAVQGMLIPTLAARAPESDRPHYRLVLAGRVLPRAQQDLRQLSARFDALLGAENFEYADKQTSGRLGPSRCIALPYDRLARLLTPPEGRLTRSWESQFKLTPLSTRRWDELGLPEPEELT